MRTLCRVSYTEIQHFLNIIILIIDLQENNPSYASHLTAEHNLWSCYRRHSGPTVLSTEVRRESDPEVALLHALRKEKTK